MVVPQQREPETLHYGEQIEEIPERLDEQHLFTTKTFGFLIHPNIPPIPPGAKIADIGTGTGIWLLDVAKDLPVTCQLTGFDISSSAFPPRSTWPPNVSFKVQDMVLPFQTPEIGTYDVVAARFVSAATTRAEWASTIENVISLLKPGGWLQWIDSCNFTLYNSFAGTSRAACQEIYDGLEPLRSKDDLVIGMMMQDSKHVRRVEIFREKGLVDVHEDIFSTDRLQDPDLRLRDIGTRNAIMCFVGCLETLVGPKLGWSEERIETLKEKAMKEIDAGAYHTLDQVCIIGKRIM